MRKKVSNFLFAVIFTSCACCATDKIDADSGKVWRKGALHCHTLWSDGRSLPETAVMTYKNLSYDFLCISEHNICPDEDLWLPVVAKTGPWPCSLSAEEYNHAMKLMSGNLISKKVSFRIYVKLRTVKELQKLFDQENQFLIIPGEEITLRDFHFNTFNIAQTLPPLASENVEEAIKQNFDQYRQAAKGKERASFFMANHPFYSAWAIDPMALVNNSDITHFEICNNNMTKDFPHVFTPDQFWDFILAHRLARGENIVYATAVDDAHFYVDAVGKSAGNNLGWVMVKCPGKMTAETLAAALKRGDFYSTNGVELETLDFDFAAKTLTVKAKVEKDVNYKIVFVVTKKDFDRSIVYKDYTGSEKKYTRRLPVIPGSIGTAALTVDGPEGAYKLQDDDLYVRAIVVSDKKSKFQGTLYPETERAWTQPLVNKNLK